MLLEKTIIVRHLIQMMVKSKQNIIGEQCIKNDYDASAVNDEDKKIALKKLQKAFYHRA